MNAFMKLNALAEWLSNGIVVRKNAVLMILFTGK